jgi:hypothetical protein
VDPSKVKDVLSWKTPHRKTFQTSEVFLDW